MSKKKMEFLTDSLKEVVNKLSEAQKEEVDIIESIINTNETNKETTKEKLFCFLEKRKPENCINFIIECINQAAIVRPKERESHIFLFNSISNKVQINIKNKIGLHVLRNMLEKKKIISSIHHTIRHIFDFADEGTVERALFEDNVELLQQLLACNTSGNKYNIYYFFPKLKDFNKSETCRIGVAALFGSVKCFKYLMMNGDEIDEDICIFAIAGGNNEIIHLCEQKGLVFKDCLLISLFYHRFEIFEWLNTHFSYEEMHLAILLECNSESVFYFYLSQNQNFEANDNELTTSIITASENGQLEVVKYLYEICHADTKTKGKIGADAINNASSNGHLEVVKYLYEICPLNVETKAKIGADAIINASLKGQLEVVKYLYETYHLNVETKGNTDSTLINMASYFGHLEVVKYLYETCHADVETKDKDGRTPINSASLNGHLDVVKYLYEKCHAYVETKDIYGYTPLKNAELHGRRDVCNYIYKIHRAKNMYLYGKEYIFNRSRLL